MKDLIKNVVSETVGTLGYKLVSCHLKGVRGKKELRVVIFHGEHDVSTEDCANVASLISGRLDIEDAIDDVYQLIVESPGVEHELQNPDEYEIFINKELKIILSNTRSYDFKDNVIIGINKGLDKNGSLVLEWQNKNLIIALEDISKTKLYFNIKKYL